jgi:tight adherence protein C
MANYISLLTGLISGYFLIFDENPIRAIHKSAGTIKDKNFLKSKLNEIGMTGREEYAKFRFNQIRSAVIAAISVLFIFTLARKTPLLALSATAIVGASVYIYAERQLNTVVRKHRESIEAEFPAVIELLTLALSSGETPLVAMNRIATKAQGALANEFSRVVSDVHSGKPFHVALDRMGRSLHSNMIRRFVDALITAMLRGAPVIDVLQRHALEARENQRNRVLGAASKAEISMMIPVVFLILPISILFALWPSLSNLNLYAT